jgi:hypothetical protein
MIIILFILSGCISNEKFSDFIKVDVEKIVAKTDKSTYSTEKADVISDFLKMMNSMPFDRTDRDSSVFSETFELYDENNEKIVTVEFVGKNIAIINDIKYEVDEVKLRHFTDIFYKDEYLADK